MSKAKLKAHNAKIKRKASLHNNSKHKELKEIRKQARTCNTFKVEISHIEGERNTRKMKPRKSKERLLNEYVKPRSIHKVKRYKVYDLT